VLHQCSLKKKGFAMIMNLRISFWNAARSLAEVKAEYKWWFPNKADLRWSENIQSFFSVNSLLFLVHGLFNFALKILFVLLYNEKRHTPRIINALKTDVHRNHKQQTVRSHIKDTTVLVNCEDQPLYVIEVKIGIYCEQKW